MPLNVIIPADVDTVAAIVKFEEIPDSNSKIRNEKRLKVPCIEKSQVAFLFLD